MDNRLLDFEKDIFEICLNNEINLSEQEKNILRLQYLNCTHKITKTGYGFYDDIVIMDNIECIDGNDSILGGIYVKFHEKNPDVSIAIFIRCGYIVQLEFYTYEQEWYGEIENYDVYEVTTDGDLSFIKSVIID